MYIVAKELEFSYREQFSSPGMNSCETFALRLSKACKLFAIMFVCNYF
jgi:hypothetical protein